MFIVFYGLSLLCMYLISAVEIQKVTLFKEEEDVTAPSRLLIPCYFTTDDPSMNPKDLLLEWRMAPVGFQSYTTILKIFNTVLEDVNNPNDRAQVFVSLIPSGNCSLLINPTNINDSGIYEVQLTADGTKYPFISRIKIYVTNPGEQKTEIFPRTTTVITEQDHTVNYAKSDIRPGLGTDCQDFDDDTARYADTFQSLKKKGLLSVIKIGIGVLQFLLFVGICFGLYYWYQYRKLKKGDETNEDMNDVKDMKVKEGKEDNGDKKEEEEHEPEGSEESTSSTEETLSNDTHITSEEVLN